MHSIWTAQQIKGGRDYQEDRFAIVENDAVFYEGKQHKVDLGILPPHQSLYLLVDGMGGMENGAVAADTVIETFIETYLNIASSSQTIAEKLKVSLSTANSALTTMIAGNKEYEGMGCTIIGVLFDSRANTIQWLSVGDSPLFLVNDREIVRINEKHTWGELAKEKRARGESIDEEHYKEVEHFLSSAVDGGEIEFIEVHDEPFTINNGDILLLASDGIETLSMSEMAEVLMPLVKTVKGEPAQPPSAMGKFYDVLTKERRLWFTAQDNDAQEGVKTIEKTYEDLIQKRKELFSLVNDAGRKDQDNTTLILCTFLTADLAQDKE